MLNAINKAIETEYYDPKAAAASLQDEEQDEIRVLHAKSKQEAVDDIRRSLAKLHNSHLLFYTRDEWSLRQNVLPFPFEKREARVFVRIRLKNSDLKFGDEIKGIDGQPAFALQPKSLARLLDVYGNPLYGAPSSLATLLVVSSGRMHKVQVRRIKLDDEDAIQMQGLGSNEFLIRFLSIANSAAATRERQDAWTRASKASALVMDLRDCSGGWPSVSSYLSPLCIAFFRKTNAGRISKRSRSPGPQNKMVA